VANFGCTQVEAQITRWAKPIFFRMAFMGPENDVRSPDKPMQYSFTEKERLYFERLQQEFQAGVAAGIRLIVTQQDLPGQWRIKPDASGLERADVPPPPNPEQLRAAMQLAPEMEKKVDGVA
jgi:hypothetical protein